ncbi:hypothetical protein, partial [Amycolatopsis japonica]
HVEHKVTAQTTAILRIQGPEHELDQIHTHPTLAWNDQPPPAPHNQPPRTAAKRDPGQAQGSTAWLLNVSKAVRRDADVVDWWHAEPPKSGPPALSEADKTSMRAFADRLLQHKPAEGEVPWDIQLHVVEVEVRLARYSEEWFKLLESELKSALLAHGVREDSELLRFDFDHITHQANKSKNIVSGVDIFVYDTTGQTIQEYQNAQSLELSFLLFGNDLMASSRRKLHWMVEALARRMDGVKSDHSLLALELRAAEKLSKARTASVIEDMKAATRKVYRENSDAKTETFIKKRTTFMHRSTKKGQGLFVDLIQRPADAPASLRDESEVVAEQPTDGNGLREARDEWQSWVKKARKKARRER